MYRTEIINSLIDAHNYQSYLEIGVNNPGFNYFSINCRFKECVDPLSAYDKFQKMSFNNENEVEYVKNNVITYNTTSDDFFENIIGDKTYDIIFIDGLHKEEQVGRDIINSLKHLNPGGSIVVHDCIPDNYEASLEENDYFAYENGWVWNGSVWKAIPELSKQNIEFIVVDTDFGCGVIKYKEHPEELHFLEKSDLEYDQVFSNITIRNNVLNVISEYEFLIRLNNGRL